MGKQILLLLPFVASAAAKAFPFGDTRSLLYPDLAKRTTIEDLMHSPLLTGYSAVEIVWAGLLGILALIILFNLRKLRSMSARAPYVLLVLGILCSVASYGINAGTNLNPTRLKIDQAFNLAATATFFFAFGEFFLLTSIIWIIHQRSALLMSSKGLTVRPVTSQTWKRSLDWILVFFFLAFEVSERAYVTMLNLMLLEPNLTQQKYEDRKVKLKIGDKLYHVLVGVMSLLILDIVLSLILLRRSGKREQFEDKAAKRLLFIVAPFAFLYMVHTVAFDVYAFTWQPKGIEDQPKIYAENLAWAVLNGTWQFGMVLGLALAMTASAPVEYSGQHGMGSSRGLVQPPQDGSVPKQPHYVQRAQQP